MANTDLIVKLSFAGSVKPIDAKAATEIESAVSAAHRAILEEGSELQFQTTCRPASSKSAELLVISIAMVITGGLVAPERTTRLIEAIANGYKKAMGRTAVRLSYNNGEGKLEMEDGDVEAVGSLLDLLIVAARANNTLWSTKPAVITMEPGAE
jgi:hypothetical protein